MEHDGMTYRLYESTILRLAPNRRRERAILIQF
jgi:hypothetical protein